MLNWRRQCASDTVIAKVIYEISDSCCHHHPTTTTQLHIGVLTSSVPDFHNVEQTSTAIHQHSVSVTNNKGMGVYYIIIRIIIISPNSLAPNLALPSFL